MVLSILPHPSSYLVPYQTPPWQLPMSSHPHYPGGTPWQSRLRRTRLFSRQHHQGRFDDAFQDAFSPPATAAPTLAPPPAAAAKTVEPILPPPPPAPPRNKEPASPVVVQPPPEPQSPVPPSPTVNGAQTGETALFRILNTFSHVSHLVCTVVKYLN